MRERRWGREEVRMRWEGEREEGGREKVRMRRDEAEREEEVGGRK